MVPVGGKIRSPCIGHLQHAGFVGIFGELGL